MWQGFAENWRAVILAIGLHVLIALLLIVGVNFVTDASSRGNHGQKIVNASVINPDSVSTDMPDAVSPASAPEAPPAEAEPEPEPEPEDDSAAEQKAAERRRRRDEGAR